MRPTTAVHARDLPVPTIAPPTLREWCRAHIAALTPRLAAAATPAEQAIHRENIAALQSQMRGVAAAEAEGAWWHVVDEDGEHHVVAYAGNGGWGPVNIYRRGRWVPVALRARHPGGGPLACCTTSS